MEITNEFIQTFQVFLNSYDHLPYGIERLNRCSILMNAIPTSPIKTQLKANLAEVNNMLTSSKLDAENLIRRTYYSLCDSHTSCTIKEASSHILTHLTNLLSTAETPSLSSVDNTYDSPINHLGSYSPYMGMRFRDDGVSFDSGDPFLLDDTLQDPWQSEFEPLTLEKPDLRVNRIAVPPPIQEIVEPTPIVPKVEPVVEKPKPNPNPKPKPTVPKKRVHIPIRHKREKDDDDDYDEEDGDDDDGASQRKNRKMKRALDEDRRFHQKPKWCHQCKARKRDVVQCCGEGKPRGANNQICFRAYCAKCLKKHYGEDYNEIRKRGKKWLCPGCRDACSCAACVRKRYADPRDIPESLQKKRNSRFFKTNKKLIHDLLSH